MSHTSRMVSAAKLPGLATGAGLASLAELGEHVGAELIGGAIVKEAVLRPESGDAQSSVVAPPTDPRQRERGGPGGGGS